jgi:glycosyltransferase involved in cell wall biosynthesis
MKILFVGFPYSVHVARWIGLITGIGHEIHLFPSQEFDAVHEDFADLTYWPATTDAYTPPEGATISVLRDSAAYRARVDGRQHADYLARVIDEGDFDVVHSLEFQHAGYLTLDAMRRLRGPRPRWIATNYGSDIFLYGDRPEHAGRIRELLGACDYYSAECRRDLALARDFGFQGRHFTVCPNNGGLDVQEMRQHRSPTPTSERRVVALKGYQHFAGRALTALTAFEACQAELRDYEIVIFSPFPEVRAAAAALAASTGLTINCLDEHVPHAEILALHGRARVSVANSISDGISTSLLEAMAMGSFPVQSGTACASEWIVHGETGYITDPASAQDIAQALRLALSDDALVDAAAALNERRVLARADRAVVRKNVRAAYDQILGD